MRLFDTDVQLLKYRVLKEVAGLAFEGNLEKGLLNIPKVIVPGPKASMRCCIYKERAIVEERVKLAMGGDEDNDNIIEVIDIACDECPVNRYSVSKACRGCIAHRCSNVCPVNAIYIDENQKANIDFEKCVECGRCMKVCPYNAVLESVRPCVKGCKVDAIEIDKDKKACINNDKCIQCGACVYQCPFGAIVDKSYILDGIKLLQASKDTKKFKVYAVIAPSIVSQFSYAKVGQVVAGIKKLGFHSVVEAALGADMVAWKEAEELEEKGFLTSSCCPSFVAYIEKNFPELVGHISANVSPMIEISRYIKQTDPTAKVIFIGPCTAKKMEYQKKSVKGIVDCVITFEELQALLDSRNIKAEELEEDVLDNASYFGRIFARSGGLSEAVAHVVKERNLNVDLKPIQCDGIEQCKVALLKTKKGRQEGNFLEGMACEGGCINGAACLSHGPKNRSDVDRYGNQALEKGISDAIKVFRKY